MKQGMTDGIYCLDENEFVSIAAACKITSLYGFEMKGDTEQSLSEKEYNYSIFTLYKKGLVSPKDGSFEMEPEIRRIFEGIKNAKRIFVFNYTERSIAPISLYLEGSGTVYMSPATDGIDYVKLGFIEEKDFGKVIEKLELIPETVEYIDMSDLGEKSGETLIVPPGNMRDISGMILTIDIVDPISHKIRLKLGILKNESGMLLMTDDLKFDRKVTYFSVEKLLDILFS